MQKELQKEFDQITGVKSPVDLVNSNISGQDSLPYMIEVRVPINPDGRDSFNRVRETLKRIGVPSQPVQGRPILNQSCHILSQGDKYYIAHFKMLYIFDGKENTLEVDDTRRLNTIVQLLEQWNLVEIVDPRQIDRNNRDMFDIAVVKHAEVKNWYLSEKYNMRHIGLDGKHY